MLQKYQVANPYDARGADRPGLSLGDNQCFVRVAIDGTCAYRLMLATGRFLACKCILTEIQKDVVVIQQQLRLKRKFSVFVKRDGLHAR